MNGPGAEADDGEPEQERREPSARRLGPQHPRRTDEQHQRQGERPQRGLGGAALVRRRCHAWRPRPHTLDRGGHPSPGGSGAQRSALCSARANMTALSSIWAWVEIALVATTGFFVQTVLFVVCLPFDRRRLVAGRAFRLVGVVAAKLNPFWRFGVVGPVPAPPRRPTVVVSNHESNADPFLISFLPWEMKWLPDASP